jgi:CubicO group peptidase (beta-lactamase class C family)
MQDITHVGRPYATGLGWFRSPKGAGRYEDAVEHYGGGGGFFTVMRLDKRTRTGVVVMGNSTKYDVEPVADGALRLLTA